MWRIHDPGKLYSETAFFLFYQAIHKTFLLEHVFLFHLTFLMCDNQSFGSIVNISHPQTCTHTHRRTHMHPLFQSSPFTVLEHIKEV